MQFPVLCIQFALVETQSGLYSVIPITVIVGCIQDTTRVSFNVLGGRFRCA